MSTSPCNPQKTTYIRTSQCSAQKASSCDLQTDMIWHGCFGQLVGMSLLWNETLVFWGDDSTRNAMHSDHKMLHSFTPDSDASWSRNASFIHHRQWCILITKCFIHSSQKKTRPDHIILLHLPWSAMHFDRKILRPLTTENNVFWSQIPWSTITERDTFWSPNASFDASCKLCVLITRCWVYPLHPGMYFDDKLFPSFTHQPQNPVHPIRKFPMQIGLGPEWKNQN